MDQELDGSPNSNNLPTSQGVGYRETTTADIAKLIARCLANYGERRGVDMRLVTAEWHEALKHYPARRINSAISEHIKKSTYWPTIANLLEILKPDTPLPGLPEYRSVPFEFAKDGRTEAEEVAFRVAQVLKIKNDCGYGKSKEDLPIAVSEPKAASAETWVTPQLQNSCAVRRARGLDTCEYNCARQSCELRNQTGDYQ